MNIRTLKIYTCFYIQVCPDQEYQRKLHADDLPLRAQLKRVQKGEICHFLVRKNPHYRRQRQSLRLTPIVEPGESHFGESSVPYKFMNKNSTTKDTNNDYCPRNSINSNIDNIKHDNDNDCNIISSNSSSSMNLHFDYNTEITNGYYRNQSTQINKNVKDPLRISSTSAASGAPYISPYTRVAIGENTCRACRQNFRSCEFCNKNISTETDVVCPTTVTYNDVTSTYNPVYNIREIRNVCNSFASLDIEKKWRKRDAYNSTFEAVNNNPEKGYGSYFYI